MATLRAGHAAAALAALDRYDAKYAKPGSLQVEAAALRIEALARNGDRERAASLAAAFLSRHPRSPYAARIRALVAPTTRTPRL